MTLLSRLLNKAPSDPPSLEDVAAGGDDEVSRIAAVRHLPYADTLRGLAGLTPAAAGAPAATSAPAATVSAAVEQAARERTAELIDQGTLDFAEFCRSAGNTTALFAVAALSKNADRLPQALATIQDPVEVARLVTEGASSRVRQLAADTITDQAQLRELLRKVGAKDKNVYKILKHKSDALNAAERKTAEFTAEVSALCLSLENLARRPFDVLYVGFFDQLMGRWRALDGRPDDALNARCETAIEQCTAVMAKHAQEVAAQSAAEQALLAQRQAANDARESEKQQREAAAAASAEAQTQREAELAEARAAEEKLRAEKRAGEDHLFRQISGLIRMAGDSLRDGDTKKAAGLRRAVQDKLPEGLALPPNLARPLQQLDSKLAELKQWKDFAVAPKRAELIEEMQSLVGSTEDPKLLAERIKALQEDWRVISKGILSETGTDWDRFHEASQAAYQPCREYFAAQSKLRSENLEKRKTVLQRLTSFEAAQAGEQADWRLIADVLREAPQEWRRHFPVERDAGRELQSRFDQIIGRLQARLDTWQAGNVADKQALIKRAQHLCTVDDGREAMDGVKRLQILWKDVGLVPRHQDQKLWSEFREACDAVFQKRHQAHVQHTASLEATKIKAVALCDEVAAIAASAGPALLEGAGKLPELRAAFEALDDVPRADARGLRDRFERAVESIENAVAHQRLRDAEQAFTHLFEAGRHVRAYEWAVLNGAEGAQQEALRAAAEAYVANVTRWPKGGLQALKGSFAKSDSLAAADAGSREKALRMLCIQSEIRCETATPSEDDQLRRDYQVQRLMQGMGQGGRIDEGDWDSMALSWVGVGAIAPETFAALETRFLACRAKRPLDAPRRPTFRPDDGPRTTRSHGHGADAGRRSQRGAPRGGR